LTTSDVLNKTHNTDRVDFNQQGCALIWWV